MPLELGLFLGAKAYSSEPKQKARRCLILDTEPYRYQKFVSDIAGQDIRAHEGGPRKALILTRNWLATVCKRKLPGPSELERLYAEKSAEADWVGKKLGIATLWAGRAIISSMREEGGRKELDACQAVFQHWC